MRIRLSRIAVVTILFGAVLAIANITRVSFAVLNAPTYVGFYSRHADIQYGRQPRQTLDVFAPHGDLRNRPVIIFWYGGFWTKGSKEEYRFVGAALAGLGYVAIVADYRLYPQVRFPQFVEDGALAVKWAQDNVARYGGDPSAIFLMGHSAGAHIAGVLAFDPRYFEQAGVDRHGVLGWIGVSGPYALHTQIPGKPILRALFREPQVPSDWKVIDLVRDQVPRTLLLHGQQDLDPRDVAALDRKLRNIGGHVECHVYPDTSHMGTVAAFSIPLRMVAPALSDLKQFVDQTVAVSHDPHAPDASIPCPAEYFDQTWSTDEPAPPEPDPARQFTASG